MHSQILRHSRPKFLRLSKFQCHYSTLSCKRLSTSSDDTELNCFILGGTHASVATTVVPVMNGHPRDQAKVSVHCRWPPIRGTLTLKCVGRVIDNVPVQGRWPLMTGVT